MAYKIDNLFENDNRLDKNSKLQDSLQIISGKVEDCFQKNFMLENRYRLGFSECLQKEQNQTGVWVIMN